MRDNFSVLFFQSLGLGLSIGRCSEPGGMNGLDGRNGKVEESACGTSLEGEVCFGDLPRLLPTGQLSNVLLVQELLQGSPVLQAQTRLITRGCETRQQGGFPTSDIITFA